jgi:hypothetical protein
MKTVKRLSWHEEVKTKAARQDSASSVALC